MTLCPIALAVGCKKCPAFSVCPLKTVLGDQKAEAPNDSTSPTTPPK
ncbi:MAG TPA: hypothetical protein VH142_12775 [Polyangiaceae bacterium]|jgi:hypothetical protein|nr:hypothetical protein [Polyangiaceae bacterium]